MTFPTVPLGSVFGVRNGATPASGEEANWDGDIPWVGPADLGQLSDRYVERGSRSITRRGYESCGTQMVPAGSIILSTRAPIGHTAIASQPLCFNQGCRGLVPSPRIDRDFAYWAVLEAKPRLQAAGQGTTFVELPRGKLRATRVSLPDLPTQKAIAAFLDRETARIDQLIEKKQRLVELLGERETSSTFHYTGGIPAGLWGCEHSKAAFPELPIDWETRKLSSLCGFVQGKAHEPYFDPEGEFVCATARFVSSGIPNRYCTQNLTPAKPNDILMVMSDLPNGRALARAYLVKPDDKIAVNQRVCALTVKEGDPRYFAYQLNRNRQLLRYNDGTNQTHLSNRAFKSLMLIVPPIDVQRRIADQLDLIVKASSRVAERTRTSIDRLKEYRSALITAAVTGQIDVETWSRRGEGDRRLDRIEEEMAG